MPLTLHYQTPESVPVEVEGIVPDAVHDKSLSEIAQLPIFVGNRSATLGDLFSLSGDPRDQVMEWTGDLRGVHWIGAHMTCGKMMIDGPAGRHVGSDMALGTIVVDGDVGDWLGAEMRGGSIRVRGNAGHQVGAAYRGSRRGMTGGTITVAGSAGNEIGHTMRRGVIAIGADCGDLVGFNMIAGTVIVLGDCGIRHGAGMRRGTIALWGTQPPTVLPSFTRGGVLRSPILDVLERQLAVEQFTPPTGRWQSACRIYHGDQLEGGRGELLTRCFD